MLRVRVSITITQVSTPTETRTKVLFFPFVNEFSVEKSFDNQTQTAKVILPRNLKYQDENLYNGANSLIRRGDKITIKSGYDESLTTDFDGYISKVSNNIPVELMCEDGMYLLKQTIAPNLSYSNVTLTTLLNDMIGTTVPYTNIEAQLGRVRIQEASIAKVLNVLRNNFGLFSFFKNGVLKVGTPFYAPEKTETFYFERTIKNNGQDLVYLKSEDVKVQIKGVLISDTGVKTEKIYGDLDGDVRTIFQYGGTILELDRLCNQKLSEMNYTGYYGSFDTFLQPKMNSGDYVILASYKMPERNGTYLVKGVTPTVGVNGGNQRIELERRVL